MAGSFGNVLLLIGSLGMAATGYLAMAHRENLRLLQQEIDGLPIHLLATLLVSTALALIGGFLASGKLKPVSLADNLPPTILRPRHHDFVTFNTRARLLASIPATTLLPKAERMKSNP